MINWTSLETVFLDMDGTLLDLHFDNHFWLEHLPKRYAEQYGLHPSEAKDKLIGMIMAEKGTLNWYCTDYWSERLAMDITGLKSEVGDRIGYRPHVADFLQALKTTGLQSVIVTNCHPDPLGTEAATHRPRPFCGWYCFQPSAGQTERRHRILARLASTGPL